MIIGIVAEEHQRPEPPHSAAKQQKPAGGELLEQAAGFARGEVGKAATVSYPGAEPQHQEKNAQLPDHA